MKQQKTLLFEISWEVCNKVGGIHTVITTKTPTAQQHFNHDYILIGPDIHHDTPNPEFIPDPTLFPKWQKAAKEHGIRTRIGHWNIPAKPIVILVEFAECCSKHKDNLLTKLWEDYQVDSLNAGWDYVEPVCFGFMAAQLIQSFLKFHNPDPHAQPHAIAHFHEWMTASGALYLRKYSPSITTVFTTHATVLGRSIAGNGLPLYDDLNNFDADEMAPRFNIKAKHSLEKAAAHNTDAFTAVSDITAAQCHALLGKSPDVITLNGLSTQPRPTTIEPHEARTKLIGVAQTALSIDLPIDPLIVLTAGRYEFKNKGLDIFIDALAQIKSKLYASDYAETQRPILAYIMVPAGHNGACRDLQTALKNAASLQPQRTDSLPLNLTHNLDDPDTDPIVQHLARTGLLASRSGVYVVFVPSYLNGNDGIFNAPYLDLLSGADLSVFASYYEPWGYTPQESIALGVPTITTDLAGFGVWAQQQKQQQTQRQQPAELHPHSPQNPVVVLHRTDSTGAEVAADLATHIQHFATLENSARLELSNRAEVLSQQTLWPNFYHSYQAAYSLALDNTLARRTAHSHQRDTSPQQVEFLSQQAAPDTFPRWTRMLVERSMPENLRHLEELTQNLWWSWNDSGRQLFNSIDPDLWRKVQRNPIALLDNLSLTDLRALADDADFQQRLSAVYQQFRAYMDSPVDGTHPRVAYFSMEYGLHSSLKIYSGGLGILAGDYLKESSDKNVPLVAVGLLYRYGYFTQRLSNSGEQEAGYEPQNFDKLPITPLRDENGEWCTVSVGLPGRVLVARIWRCMVGRTALYLMDVDTEQNAVEDRAITHHLYGGDLENRLRQEYLLGIGGIRLLQSLGISADVYHCNEGHAAFIGLARSEAYIRDRELSFSESLEVVRSSSLFTTHTPVPAGHDEFDEGLVRQYLSHFPERLKLDWEQFFALGRTPDGKFSMSVLACNMSQEINGVSWLHGEVTKEILGEMWPGYLPSELPIGYVTNGVHYPTWTSDRLKDVYAEAFGADFRAGDYSYVHWQRVFDIPDSRLWDARLYLKQRLLNLISRRVVDPTEFRFDSPRQLVQIQESLRNDVLTIGFARRFATYKRAHLLFTNLDRLSALVNNPIAPVQFVFAGKAHPADKAGQDLIKRIVEVSKMSQFTGKILFLQNYDMELARRMVQGVDVWLNTPTRPQEASGTSGQKAVMNGVLQFSVLDGWWVEGYRPDSGWMLPMERTFEDQRFQDELDAEVIYATIEDKIVPTYYARNAEGHSPQWMQMVKHCICDVASRFTTRRMIDDYRERFYDKLASRHTKITQNDFQMARQLAAWKRRVSKHWPGVKVVGTQQFDQNHEAIIEGHSYKLEVRVDLGGLQPTEVGVELLVAKTDPTTQQRKVLQTTQFTFTGVQQDGVASYILSSDPERCGVFDFAIRVYPHHENMSHRQDLALVVWA